MSSRAGKVKKQIVQQRLTTVCDVLTIMQNEADQMSWFQRFCLSQRFLWTKNLDSFFQIATKNKKKRAKNEEKTV